MLSLFLQFDCQRAPKNDYWQSCFKSANSSYFVKDLENWQDIIDQKTLPPQLPLTPEAICAIWSSLELTFVQGRSMLGLKEFNNVNKQERISAPTQ